MGDWIELQAADGHRLSAYRALPSGEPRGGLVVVQEIFGVNGHIRAVCDGYAAEGYAAVAPALFDRVRRGVVLGYTPEGTAEGRALRAQLGWEKPLADLEAAAADLRAHGRVAAIGYCWGGSLAFLAGCRLEVAAAVGYYGGQIVQFLDERPRAPLLLHFGEKDPLIPAADREKIAARYGGDGGAEIYVYDAGHGFNCTERQDFEPLSAALAKERTLAFLERYVEGDAG